MAQVRSPRASKTTAREGTLSAVASVPLFHELDRVQLTRAFQDASGVCVPAGVCGTVLMCQAGQYLIEFEAIRDVFAVKTDYLTKAS